MIRLVPRERPSQAATYLAPVAAVALTAAIGLLLFAALGKEPARAVGLIFLAPLADGYALSEIVVKATPLALIAIGLSFGFRAGVWNIGAEGQFTVGAIAAGAVALAFYDTPGLWLAPLMCLAGAAAGMAWAAVPALLRTRFNTNEILTSLMLTYVATLLLSVLVHGALRDPDGMNFPESRLFHDAATLPILVEGTRIHVGALAALLAVGAAWLVFGRHIFGVQTKVFGQAPRAARFAGFIESRIVWSCFAISGGLAGLAGAFEAAGSVCRTRKPRRPGRSAS